MPASPLVTLKAILQALNGAFVPGAKLRVTLINYGSETPVVAGSGAFTPVSQDFLFTSNTVLVPLFGNDVITPTDTRYMVQLIDPTGAVVATNEYEFRGTGEIDLSVALPYDPDSSEGAAQGVIQVLFSQGLAGPSPVLSIGTVTAGGVGEVAATITGSIAAPMLNLTLPAGPDGPAGPPTVFAGLWSPTNSYSKGQAMYFPDGSSYVSLQDTNLGHNPTMSTGWWALQAKAGTPTTFTGPYNSGTTYLTGQAASYNGSSYVSLQDANTGNAPDASGSTFWGLQAAQGQAGQTTHTDLATASSDAAAEIAAQLGPGFSPNKLNPASVGSGAVRVDGSVDTSVGGPGGFTYVTVNCAGWGHLIASCALGGGNSGYAIVFKNVDGTTNSAVPGFTAANTPVVVPPDAFTFLAGILDPAYTFPVAIPTPANFDIVQGTVLGPHSNYGYVPSNPEPVSENARIQTAINKREPAIINGFDPAKFILGPQIGTDGSLQGDNGSSGFGVIFCDLIAGTQNTLEKSAGGQNAAYGLAQYGPGRVFVPGSFVPQPIPNGYVVTGLPGAIEVGISTNVSTFPNQFTNTNGVPSPRVANKNEALAALQNSTGKPIAGSILYAAGASITFGAGITGSSTAPNGGILGCYMDLLGKSSWGALATSYNGGNSGHTTTQVLAEYNSDSPSAHSLGPVQAGNKAKCWYFLNLDAVNNDSPNGISLTTSISNLQNIVAAARADGWYVVILSCVIQASGTNWNAPQLAQNQAAAQAVRNKTIACDLFIDMVDWLPNQADTLFYASVDNTHPTAVGNAAIAANLVAAMNAGGSVANNYTAGYHGQPQQFRGGAYLFSPNGTRYSLQVDNNGNLTVTQG